MLKRSLTLVFLLPCLLFAQQKFFLYRYNDQYGLSDITGKQVITGNFIRSDEYLDKHILFDTKEQKNVLVNIETGEQKLFDEFIPNSIFLENQYFANVEDKGKYYLYSQKTGEKLEMPVAIRKQNFPRVFMLNKDYLYAIGSETIFPKTPEVKKPKSKASASKVPAIIPEPKLEYPITLSYLYIFKNERSMPLVSKIKLDEEYRTSVDNPTNFFKLFNLHKTPKNEPKKVTEINIVERKVTEGLVPWHFYYNETFDIAAIEVKDSIRVLDSNLKVLQTIAIKDRSVEDILFNYLQAKYPNDEIGLSHADFFASPMMSSGNKAPYWKANKVDDHFELAFKEDDGYKTFARVEAQEAEFIGDQLKLKDKKGNTLSFKMDWSSMAFPIPKQLKEQFKLSEIK
mgnify:CR=1 FL=1